MDLLTVAGGKRTPAGAGARADGAGEYLVAAAAVADPAGRGLHLRRAVAPRPRRRRRPPDLHRAVRRRPRRCGRDYRRARRPDRPFDGRTALVVPGRDAARAGGGVGRRGHGAGLPRPNDRAVGAVAARAAGRIRLRRKGVRRVRSGGGRSTSSRRSTAQRPGGGCTGIPMSVDRDRRGVGHPRLLGAVARRYAFPTLLHRGGQLRDPAGQMARDGARPDTGPRIYRCPAPVT